MPPHGTLSRSSAAIMRNFVQATALRLVASIVQESLPGTSGHALRHTVCAPLRGACRSTEQRVRLAKLAVLRRCSASFKLHKLL